MSHYETLGIKRDATPDEIKTAYRRACREHHPDKHGGDHGPQAAINEAYEVLSDPVKRQDYDSGHGDKVGRLLRAMFAEALETDMSGTRLKDLVGNARDALEQKLIEKRLLYATTLRRQERLRAMIGRIEANDVENIFDTLIREELAEIDDTLERLTKDIDLCVTTQARLSKYKDKMAAITDLKFPTPATY